MSRTYIDRQGRAIFVHDGISGGRWYAVYYRTARGTLRRVKSPKLPECATPEAAQRCLDDYARARGLRAVET